MEKLGFYRNQRNLLEVQSIDIKTLIDKYGSPLYVYDGNLIETCYHNLRNALKPINGHIHYAIKANDNLGIIKLLNTLGSGADVVSIGELKKCIKAGIKPQNIIFSGVGKNVEEIQFAILNKIKQINIKKIKELEDVISISKKLKKNVNVAIRVNLDISPQTHKKISTGEESSKFGVSLRNVVQAYKIISKEHFLKPAGLAIHIGSQIFDINLLYETYFKLKQVALSLIKQGLKVENLDLGGGFGVNYDKFEVKKFEKLKQVLSKLFVNSHFNISLEPGRAILADSGILVTKVIRTKKTLNKNFLIVDSGMNDFIRPTLYNASHRFIPLKKIKARSSINYDIVGPICETGDYFGLNIKMQNIHKNEYLAIMSAGAYGSVMSSNYNTRPNLAEVLVYKGKVSILRKRQTIDDLISKDLLPEF